MSSSEKHHFASTVLISDPASFRGQESLFVILNLFVLAILLLIHSLFSSYFGDPSRALIAILAVAFVVEALELAWLQARTEPFASTRVLLLTGFSVAMNFGLAFALAELSGRQDTQYFILMVVPVLESAFRLSLLPTLAVVAAADFINLFWVWHYVDIGPGVPVGEYFEAGTVSLIYTVVGILVWLLVNQLNVKDSNLSQSLRDLQQARERLLHEEKLAAVGRLSSAIAHEIRNPVAIIGSALSTARATGTQAAEREEMFDIAAKEAGRLEKLTTDFLTYARPRGPERVPSSLDEIMGYVADVCRPPSSARGVNIITEFRDLRAWVDAGQVQQALINLAMNAIEASAPADQVILRAVPASDGLVQIDVQDAAGPIPVEVVSRMFEPFFTTKAGGTGLGLAIARNIARAHGGDLVLSLNEPGRVCFSLTLPATGPGSSPNRQGG
ncbi:MAG TPA: ATP-binding protein [Terriglobia bacterium]|nr:ATP-binding protein [Terriglobia bacterium]